MSDSWREISNWNSCIIQNVSTFGTWGSQPKRPWGECAGYNGFLSHLLATSDWSACSLITLWMELFPLLMFWGHWCLCTTMLRITGALLTYSYLQTVVDKRWVERSTIIHSFPEIEGHLLLWPIFFLSKSILGKHARDAIWGASTYTPLLFNSLEIFLPIISLN